MSSSFALLTLTALLPFIFGSLPLPKRSRAISPREILRTPTIHGWQPCACGRCDRGSTLAAQDREFRDRGAGSMVRKP
jgi:hypothetical protein